MAETRTFASDVADDLTILDAFMAETDDDDDPGDRGEALERARLLLAAARDAIAELIEPASPTEPDTPPGDVETADLGSLIRRVAEIEDRLIAIEARVD